MITLEFGIKITKKKKNLKKKFNCIWFSTLAKNYGPHCKF